MLTMKTTKINLPHSRIALETSWPELKKWLTDNVGTEQSYQSTTGQLGFSIVMTRHSVYTDDALWSIFFGSQIEQDLITYFILKYCS